MSILLSFIMLYRSLDSSDDGVENFYPTSPPLSNNASAGSTPLTGSPLLDGGPSLPSGSAKSSGGIFSHLKSTRSKNISKEDLSSSASSSLNNSDKGKDGGATKKQSFESNLGVLSISDRKSPIPTTKSNDTPKHKYEWVQDFLAWQVNQMAKSRHLRFLMQLPNHLRTKK